MSTRNRPLSAAQRTWCFAGKRTGRRSRSFADTTGLAPIPEGFSDLEARRIFYEDLADVIDHLDDLLPPLAETPEAIALELAVEEAAGAVDP